MNTVHGHVVLALSAKNMAGAGKRSHAEQLNFGIPSAVRCSAGDHTQHINMRLCRKRERCDAVYECERMRQFDKRMQLCDRLSLIFTHIQT